MSLVCVIWKEIVKKGEREGEGREREREDREIERDREEGWERRERCLIYF